MEAEHLRHADRHVGIAGEIEVDLQRVADDAQPGRLEAQLRGRQGENLVDGGRHDVGDEDFLAQPDHESRGAAGEVAGSDGAGGQFPRHRDVADDRPGHQLREERDEAGEIEEVARGPRVPAIHVDGVAHRLEGVEADAQGQGDLERVVPLQGVEASQAEEAIVAGHAEAEVLEESQQREVGDDRGRQGRLLQPASWPADGQLPDFAAQQPAGHDQSARVVGPRGQQHDADAEVLAPKVEQHAGQQQQQIRELAAEPWAIAQPAGQFDGVVEEQNEGQKQEQEGDGTEDHAGLPCRLVRCPILGQAGGMIPQERGADNTDLQPDRAQTGEKETGRNRGLTRINAG